MVARLLKAVFTPLAVLSTRRTRTDVLPHGGRHVTSLHDAVAQTRQPGQLVFHYGSGGHISKVEWVTVEHERTESA